MKKFFATTKYLWLGAIMGLLQQLFGDLDYILYQGNNEIFSFSGIMGGLSIYAAIILLVIRRDVPPKHQFRDLLLLFIGLDFFYYLYEFIILVFHFMTDSMTDNSLGYALPSYGIEDFIFWTSIGLAAAVWAFVATKLRNMEKKKLYIIMLLPLFAVIALELYMATSGTIMYFVTGGGMKVHDPSLGSDAYMYTDSAIASTLTSLIALVLCLYKFLKKPSAKKNHTQET